MRKTLRLARREYRAAVRTKGFIIGLVVAPVMMSGSGIAMALLKDRVDTKDQRLAVVDFTEHLGEALVAAAEERNQAVVLDAETGKKVRPAYVVELVPPNRDDPEAQGLGLSDRVRMGDLHAFVQIGPDVVNPGEDRERWRITYHSRNPAIDDLRGWLPFPLNAQLRQLRLVEAGVDSGAVQGLLQWIPVEAMGLVERDEATGEVQGARRASEAEAVLVPIVFWMLMFLMIMMGAMPLLNSVMEEKGQRISEVMLGSMGPFEFMMGKVLGGIWVSTTAWLIYVIVGVVVVRRLGWSEFLPYEVLPWFFAYMLTATLMMGSILAGLGSACNDAKEAQNLTFPALLPMMIPAFLLLPILRQPNGSLPTLLSFVPPFTPTVMLLRQSSPEGVPGWQPWLGLAGILVFTVFAVWAGGRIFRVSILIQGTPPKLGNLLRWALRG